MALFLSLAARSCEYHGVVEAKEQNMKTVRTTPAAGAVVVAASWPWTPPIQAAAAHAVKRMCISSVPGVALLLAWGGFAATGLAAEPATNVDATADAKADAAVLVHAALMAEVSGNRELRRDRLRDALKKDPDFALAHWSAGEVRRDGQWLTLEEAQRQAAADKRLAEYRSQRGTIGGHARRQPRSGKLVPRSRVAGRGPGALAPGAPGPAEQRTGDQGPRCAVASRSIAHRRSTSAGRAGPR